MKEDSNADGPDALGFPPGTLFPEPARLPVLARGSGWIALDKPAGIGLREHPWDTDSTTLDGALNQQLEDGKPELTRIGASVFASVYYLDPVVSGIAVLAINHDTSSKLRNAAGSGQIRFRTLFVAENRIPDMELTESTPLLAHRGQPKMVPSSAKGKQSLTRFVRLSPGQGRWALWVAECTVQRPHQVRAHAALAGIPVLGDKLYGGPAVPVLADIRKGAKGKGIGREVFDGIPLRLAAVELPGNGGRRAISAGFPGPWRNLLRKLSLPVVAAGELGSCAG